METYAGEEPDECTPIRVLIVDDHTVVREALRGLLAGEPDIEVVGEAGTGEAAITMLDVTRPDVVLMDIRMPGMGGVEATRVIRSTHAGVRVLILTAHPEYAADAVRAGAWGYLLKTAASAQLLAALRSVFYGTKVFQEQVAEGLSLLGVQPRAESAGGLSPRELEVLRLLARGLTNRAIARTLGIGPRTADQHVHSIFIKVGARSRAQAVLYAVEHRLAGGDPRFGSP